MLRKILHLVGRAFERTSNPGQEVHRIECEVNEARLENEISKVGRDRVFALVKSAGWRSGEPVPYYVWWQAVAMCRQSQGTAKERADETRHSHKMARQRT